MLFTYFQIARAPSSASLNQLTRAYTISFWVRRHLGHSDARPLIARLTAMANNTYLYLLTFDNDGRLFLTSGATTISDPNPVAQSFGPAGWVHFAAVFDGTHLRLYRAGVEVASAMAPNTLVASDAPLILGSQPIPPTGSGYASYADSALDEIRIYAVALTPAQIATLAQ